MKKRYKIIIITSLCLLLLFGFSISSFAFDDTYTNSQNETLYMFRKLYSVQFGNLNYYFEIYTRNQVEQDYFQFKRQLNSTSNPYFTYDDYIKLRKISFRYNQWQYMDTGFKLMDDTRTLYSLLAEFGVSYQDCKNVYRSSIYDSGISIGDIFMSGRYIFNHNNTQDIPSYITNDYDSTAKIELSYGTYFYQFCDSFFQALCYSAEITNSGTGNNPSNIAFAYSETLRDYFCVSLYNLLYYEFGKTNIVYNDIVSSVYGNYARNENDNTHNVELFMANNEVYANKITGNFSCLAFINSPTSFDVDEKNTSFYFFSSKSYFLNGVFLDWLPTAVKGVLITALSLIMGVAIVYAIKHLIVN